MAVQTESRKYRSWVTRTNPAAGPFSRFSSQTMVSRSRWLVGSSRVRKLAPETRQRASAAFLTMPPERVPIGTPVSSSPSSLQVERKACSRPYPPSCSILRVSSAKRASFFFPSCISRRQVRYSLASRMSGPSPAKRKSSIVIPAGKDNRCSRVPMARSLFREIVPASGSSPPPSSFRKVDLPEPFLPMRPILSPASMPRVTSSKRGSPPRLLRTPVRDRTFIDGDYTHPRRLRQRGWRRTPQGRSRRKASINMKTSDKYQSPLQFPPHVQIIPAFRGTAASLPEPWRILLPRIILRP